MSMLHPPAAAAAAAIATAVAAAGVTFFVVRRLRCIAAPESTAVEKAKAKVWDTIGGAMQASQVYLGDRLGLYVALAQLTRERGSFTVLDVEQHTGLHHRWLREWCAQQAAMGVLELQSGTGDNDADLVYVLPDAFAEVLADPLSPHYDISLIQAVPALLERVRTTIPEAFRTGLGVSYNDPDVTAAIDRHHQVSIRHFVLPTLLPSIAGGRILAALERGVRVADLGCGGGNMMFALAERFPRSNFHGYEVSEVALMHATTAIAATGARNVLVHDAREAGSSLGDADPKFELILTYDVLHDAPYPEELIRQARRALAPKGVWLIADILCEDGIRANVRKPGASMQWAFSTCLCMACALSEPDGTGLGTLGFTPTVAKRMLGEAGFGHVRIAGVDGNQQWFEVAATDPSTYIG